MTPLEMVKRVKLHYPEVSNAKIGYAGRLDPMAEGLLLLLVGDENKRKTTYESLQKTYVVDVLFGVATDTYDILGLVTTRVHKIIAEDTLLSRAREIICAFPGTHEQLSPNFSAKRYKGKPLYYWARLGMSPTVDQPKKTIQILESSVTSTYTISSHIMEQTIIERIALVSGNFRQDEIRASWKKVFSDPSCPVTFPIMRMTITCTSGTYMRSLAHDIGVSVGEPALAWNIARTAIGTHEKADTIV